MTHPKNKVEWCLKKAGRELEETGRHRGLILAKPDVERAREHIKKAEHYLRATDYLKRGNFSDISAGTVFYSMYHCLLAIAAKFGYESRNQDCTFALMHMLAGDGKINFEKELLDRIASLDAGKTGEKTSVELREQYQYGTSLSIGDDIYKELLELAKIIISRTKVIMEG